jgi:hypothetical protein
VTPLDARFPGVSDQLTLFEAVRRYKAERGTCVNKYEWYRKFASQGRAVRLGSTSVKATKVRGVWLVAAADVARAIKAHRAERADEKRVTEDHARGVYHGKDGQTVRTAWGEYSIRGGFRIESRYGKDGGSTFYYCTGCNRPATEKRERPECHRCEDWGGCGRDCRLSEVVCAPCDRHLGVFQ